MFSTRSSFRTLIVGLAVAAFSAVSVAYDEYVVPIGRTIGVAWALGWDWVIGRIAAVAAKMPRAARVLPAGLPRHQVAMRDYVQRQTRLQVARLLPQWRMAPSV
jgi:hypothetical protein